MLGNLFYKDSDPEILIYPKTTPEGESTRKGVYLAGEAAGTPLLKNGLNSGTALVDTLAIKLKGQKTPDGIYHLAILGAGPAGLAAAMRAKKLGLSYILVEQAMPAQTIENFHKGKPIFAEPSNLENNSDLWFEECHKEELLEKWCNTIKESELNLHLGETFTDIKDKEKNKVVCTDKGEYEALAVILATGKSGNPRKLSIPGEKLPHVMTNLNDPDYYTNNEITVIGAGDSAAEIAIALAQENKVHLIVRRNKIDRPKQRNRDMLFACERAGKIEIHYNSKPLEITESDVHLDTDKGRKSISSNHVFLALGNNLPLPLYRKLGIKLENDWDIGRGLKFVVFTILVSMFYLWGKEFLAGVVFPESWGMYGGDTLHLYGWTQKLSDIIGYIPAGPAIWTGAIYTGIIVGFGLHCIYKYRKDSFQVKRYCIIMFSQVILMWLIPEVLFQGILKLADGWRSYGLVLPAPLYVWNFKSPLSANLFWLIWFMTYSFIGVPLIARYTGKKFCSWFCGCGCLAETFGDPWRKLAPRGRKNRAREKFGQWTILAIVCMVVSYGMLNPDSSIWNIQKVFVDFLLASIIGVCTYPFWGGRIWCRFLCPLARVLHFSAGNTSDVKISSGTHCIECGLCSKYCQMGIPVMEFAKNAESFDNKNSSCIQCGICVTVCPVRNLQHNDWDEKKWEDEVTDGAMARME